MSQSIEPKNAKVLIVDDMTANLDLLRDMLKSSGYQIFFATSGEVALKIAASTLPDIILLDVMMPGMDGFETCRRLKETQGLRNIPVIFVTAKTEVEDLVRGFNVGGVDYITKPVKQPEVHAWVQTHLQIQTLIKQQKENLAALEHAKKELQELNATKDRFLSNIGRDVRDSLAEISSASAALKASVVDSRLSGDDLDYRLEGVNKSAESVLRLLENILEWPRVQVGQKLDLFNTQITDHDLAYLIGSLDNLRFLSLAETKISDAGLVHLKALKVLQELHLDNTSVTDNGLVRLASLQTLQILDLKGTKITDAGLAHLRPLQNLRGLYLTRTGITDAGLTHLTTLGNLETLILWDTRISDTGLLQLRPLKNLRELILWNTQVTEKGADGLRRGLPDCDISTDMFV